MRLQLVSWDAHAINGGSPNYEAVIPPAVGMPEATPNFIDRDKNWPFLAGKTLNGGMYVFQIIMRGDITVQLETLKSWFRTDDFVFRKLVAQDTADSNNQWYLEGYPTSPPTLVDVDGSSAVNITLALKNPYWKEVTITTDTWAIAGTGQTRNTTPKGLYATRPIFKITANSTRTGEYAYKRFVVVYNPVPRPMPDYQLSITGDGISTSALIPAKMRADGYDCRAQVDAQDEDRWLDGINTASTRVFINLSFKAGIQLVTLAALDGATTPAYITFAKTPTNKNAIKKLPKSGMLLYGSEIITYSNLDITKMRAITVSRAAKTTSIAAHAAGITVYWVEHEIWWVYGKSTETAPDIDDDVKPVQDLTSTKTSLVYTTFASADGLRTGGWRPAVLRKSPQNDNIFTYTGDHADVSADPATDIGAVVGAFQSGPTWKGDKGRVEWKLHHPAGFNQLTSASGDKFRTSGSFPTCKIQKSLDGKNWVDVIPAIATPSVANTWQAWTAAGTPIAFGAGDWLYVRFLVDGTQAAGVDAYCACEMNAITLGLISANVPQVTVLAEQSVNTFNCTISNNTTGDSFSFTYHGDLSKEIVIDCDEQTAQTPDGQSLLILTDSNRTEWLTIDPTLGTNVLQVDDSGIVDITFKTITQGWNLI